ncbi:MAG: RHS repeat-associated core domain-containing protein, partial [Candidatus Paceibacterota bacterium]
LRYEYDQTRGLRTIADLNGNVVTFTENAITHSSGQSIQLIRDHRDRIKEIIDPAGNALRYTYDLAGDLVTFTNQANVETRYEYLDDPEHYLDQAFDSLGRRVLKAVYEQNPETGQFEFKGVIDAAGNRIDDRDFDTDQNQGVVRDGNGNATTLVYDDRGNVLEEIDPLGNTTFRQYDDARNPDLETRIIDREGNITDREYDARGNLTTIVERGSTGEPLDPPVVTDFTYDSGNRVTSITNARDATTTFRYDTKGNLTGITNAEGNSAAFTYDSQGRRQTFTDFNGNTTTFEYASGDQPTRVIFADDTYQRFAYNQFGQVTLEEFYEADDTLVERRETKYDNSGRVLEEISGIEGDPNHPRTVVRKVYDGHLLDWEIIVNPASPNETPATPVDQRQSRITDFEYDANDNLIRQTDAEGGVVEFRYDANGNRVMLQDPVGNITTWVYDTLNRVSEERDPFYNEGLTIDQAVAELATPSGASCETNSPAEHVRLTCYDGEGNQTKAIDRNGRRREFEYDQAGRLLVEQWYNAPNHATAPAALVETISFTYDTLGNMLTASDSNSNYLFSYDTLNRLTSVDNNPDGTREVPRVILTYGYDAQGNVTLTQDDAGVTVESEYDQRNRLQIRKWFDADVPADETPDVDPARVDFLYNAAGREAEIRRYSDLDASILVGRTVRTYDLAGRSDLLTHRNAVDELLAGYDYDYDFSGLLVHEERTHQDAQFAQSIDYGYDLTGQLIDALFSGQDDEHYEYDANGNRITSQVGADQRTYTTGPANQLASDGIYRYEYDGEGNLVLKTEIATGEATVYEYDHRNRLVRVTIKPSAESDIILTEVEYTYDALNRRIAWIANGETIHFVYNGDNVWADFNEVGAAVARYLFGNQIDQNIARFQTEERLAWYLTNLHGSIRDLGSPSGSFAKHFSFAAFGDVLEQPSLTISDRFLFAAREFDIEIPTYYYRARSLDPIAGRFLSQDPQGFAAGDLNLYRFVVNSPTNATDPTGTIALATYAAIAAVGVSFTYGYLGAPADVSICAGLAVASLGIPPIGAFATIACTIYGFVVLID